MFSLFFSYACIPAIFVIRVSRADGEFCMKIDCCYQFCLCLHLIKILAAIQSIVIRHIEHTIDILKSLMYNLVCMSGNIEIQNSILPKGELSHFHR